MSIEARYKTYAIHHLKSMFSNNQLNLEPGFQRHSVWTLTDRRRLIESIFSGYPLPSLFLYKRDQNGELIYDVIDGKQRLETIFMYAGLGRFRRENFEVKLDIGGSLGKHNWKNICQSFPEKRAAFDAYDIQVVEVTAELPLIVDLFLRINSTGRKLSSGEKRNAKFYKSPFLKEAEKLVRRFRNQLTSQKILSFAQIDRMKGTELCSELLMSIQKGGPINKKIALDRAIGNDSIRKDTLKRIVREFIKTMNLVKKMFPSLQQTRLHNSAEFYTLFLLVWEMDKENFVLADNRRNTLAFELLRKLSIGVDELRQRLRDVKPAQQSVKPLFSEYLLTVQGDTDSSRNREQRRQILKKLLFSLYERKDDRRSFTPEQRRLIWNSDQNHLCVECKKSLTWNDFTVDHIIAYAKGGKTSLKSAQLMCRSCNSRKGTR